MDSSENDLLNNQTVISFYSGNPTIQLTSGEIHLFQPSSQITDLKRSKILAVLGVPSYISISEFYMFAGAYRFSMKHIRVVRSTVQSISKYFLIIKFDEQKDADSFHEEYNQKRFSSMTDENCYVAYVNKVVFLNPKNTVLFPPSGQTETPTCTICLEKLSPKVSGGLLTILCNHSFHSMCLAQWRDENRCPICRYTQTPFGEKSVCLICNLEDNLWLCLVCGFIGCSRYMNKHAQEHFDATKHTYALELESQKVWDYTKEAYLHRLVSSNCGKVVEVVQTNTEQVSNTVKQTDFLMDTEEASALEWQMLLSAQIETQKKFYEERIADLENESLHKICDLEKEVKNLIKEKDETTNKIDVIANERKLLESKTSALQKRLKGVVQETQFLKTMNLALAKNKETMINKVKETEELSNVVGPKDLKIQELERQVQELMKTLEQEATEEGQIYNNISIPEEKEEQKK